MNLFKTIIFLIFFILTPLFIKPLYAAVRCETQYGGGEVCVKTGALQVDKEVWHNQENKFVDNLGITDLLFSPGEEASFRLKIKNVGDDKFDKVSVKDTLPSFLELSSGYSLTFEISDLTPGEVEERIIKAKVVSDNRIPKGTVCDINTAEAWADNEHDKNTSQICVAKKVLGVTVIPSAGPKDWLQYLSVCLTLGITGIVGLYLLKFYKNKGGEK